MARTDITDRRNIPARRSALPPWGRRRRIWWASGIRPISFGSYCEHSQGSTRLSNADVQTMAREKPCFHGKSRMKAQIYRDGQLVVQTKAEAVKCGMASSPFPRIDEFFVLHRHCGVDSVDVWPDPEIEAPGLHR